MRRDSYGGFGGLGVIEPTRQSLGHQSKSLAAWHTRLLRDFCVYSSQPKAPRPSINCFDEQLIAVSQGWLAAGHVTLSPWPSIIADHKLVR